MEREEFRQYEPDDDETAQVNDSDDLYREDDALPEDLSSENEDSGAGDDATDGHFSSPEEAQEAYLHLLEQLGGREGGSDELARRIEQLEGDIYDQRKQAEERELWEELRKSYNDDPLGTTEMMIKQAAQDHWNVMQEMVGQAMDGFARTTNLRHSMSRVLEKPENKWIKPYSDQMEYLVVAGGMDTDDAIDFIRSIAQEQARYGDKRSAAAKEVRRRSATESSAGSETRRDADREFDRVLEKSKTLDDMLRGISKLKL